jgi:hypothetical protein
MREILGLIDRQNFQMFPENVPRIHRSRAQENPGLLVESGDEEAAGIVIEELLEEAERMELNEDEPFNQIPPHINPAAKFAAVTQLNPTPKPSKCPHQVAYCCPIGNWPTIEPVVYRYDRGFEMAGGL